MLLYTCAPSGVWPLRVFLVIVGLQDVAVLGHHEDWDEVNNSKRQKLSLLTVLLKQTTYTKWSVCVSSFENSDSWVVTWLFCICFSVQLTISLKTTALRRLISMSWRSLSKSLTGDIPPVTASTGLCMYVWKSNYHQAECSLLQPLRCLLIHVFFMQ